MELGAVARVICLLEALSSVKSLNLEAVSMRTGLPKATALRILSSLVEQGYVNRDSYDRYSLTLRMFTIGSRTLSHLDILDAANPVAEALSDETGETVHVGILESNRAVYILKKESRYTIRMNSRVGRSIPLYCSAIGKCLLASMPNENLESYLKYETLTRYTPNTICGSEELKAELSKVRKQGFSIDNEEHEEGIFCLAAPIVNGYDETVAAMSVSKPVFRLDKASFDGLSAKVRQSCESVSRILGHV